MGNLVGRDIVQSRVYINPADPNPAMPEYDFKFTYPVTIFSAVLSDYGDNPQNLRDVLALIDDKISQRQPKIPAGSTTDVMMWTNTEGNIGKMPVVRSVSVLAGDRSDSRIPSEKAIGTYVDTKAPLSLFNAHVSDVIQGNTNNHVSTEEREYWNNMAPLQNLQDHITNTEVHVTTEDRVNWDGKASGTVQTAHITNTNNPHKVTAVQVDTYTRAQIRDLIQSIQPRFFNYKNIFWDTLQNPPAYGIEQFKSENWDPNYVFDHRYNQDYFVNPSGTMTDGTTFTIDPETLRTLPDLLPGKQYFALVAKLPPDVDGRSGPIQIYFKDLVLPWAKVAEVTSDNGDMFITYPDRKIYLWVGGQFSSMVTSSLSES